MIAINYILGFLLAACCFAYAGEKDDLSDKTTLLFGIVALVAIHHILFINVIVAAGSEDMNRCGHRCNRLEKYGKTYDFYRYIMGLNIVWLADYLPAICSRLISRQTAESDASSAHEIPKLRISIALLSFILTAILYLPLKYVTLWKLALYVAIISFIALHLLLKDSFETYGCCYGILWTTLLFPIMLAIGFVTNGVYLTFVPLIGYVLYVAYLMNKINSMTSSVVSSR